MHSARRFSLFVVLAVSAALFARHGGVRDERPYDVSFVPAASAVRWTSLGHSTFAANLYWLRTVQYIGEPHANARGWDHLYPLTNLVTDLDRRHGYAYQVAGILLGSVGRISESNAILEKGIRAVPERYIIPYLRAFNAFYYAGDFAEAGRFVDIATRAPDAPPHISRTALAFYVKGRSTDAAIAFLERLQSEAHDAETAKAVRDNLKQAYLERDAQVLEDAATKYRHVWGAPPKNLQQLVDAKLIERIPSDPYGGKYVVGGDGKVRSTAHPFRYKGAEEIPRGVEPGVPAPLNERSYRDILGGRR